MSYDSDVYPSLDLNQEMLSRVRVCGRVTRVWCGKKV